MSYLYIQDTFMTQAALPYQIFPLGDSAITIEFGNCIDEAINNEVIARFNQLRSEPIPYMIEAVPAYSSLTIYFDTASLLKKLNGRQIMSDWIKEQIAQRMSISTVLTTANEKTIDIPVCYGKEFGPDLSVIANKKNIPVEEVIASHTAKIYKVFMLGFLPGFAYMGEVEEKIAISRKPQPVNVAAGSVGIAGKQTGIYPLASPGGWQIIGRTPLKLFDATKDDPCLLEAGDRIRFYSITKDEFENY